MMQSMLARVAERMYWFGRYVERAENMARLISVNTNLVLDLPRVKHVWGSMIDITGSTEEFSARFSQVNERNVVKFLLEDESGSLRAAVRSARENARTTREIIPTEAWERINELHIYVNRNLEKAIKRDGRHKFLSDVLALCNQLTGQMAGNMSADTAYNFIRIGRNLERADMTTRIVDVGCINLMSSQEEITEYENILWMNVLRSLTAYQMYRQHVRDRVNGEDVVDFLLCDENFPRAVAHCLNEVHACCERMPHSDPVVRAISHLQRLVSSNDAIELLKASKLHEFIDEIQLDLANIHSNVAETWFGHEPESISSQEQVEAT